MSRQLAKGQSAKLVRKAFTAKVFLALALSSAGAHIAAFANSLSLGSSVSAAERSGRGDVVDVLRR